MLSSDIQYAEFTQHKTQELTLMLPILSAQTTRSFLIYMLRDEVNIHVSEMTHLSWLYFIKRDIN